MEVTRQIWLLLNQREHFDACSLGNDLFSQIILLFENISPQLPNFRGVCALIFSYFLQISIMKWWGQIFSGVSNTSQIEIYVAIFRCLSFQEKGVKVFHRKFSKFSQLPYDAKLVLIFKLVFSYLVLLSLWWKCVQGIILIMNQIFWDLMKLCKWLDV